MYFLHVKSLKILYVMVFYKENMFHYYLIPYFTCNFFTKFTFNEYIGPYFYRTSFLKFSPVTPRANLLTFWA